MLKRLLVIVLAVSLLIVFFGCGDDDEVIAIVNGEEITREQYKQKYERMEKIYESQGADIEAMEEELEKQIIDELVVEKILIQEAEKKSLEIEDEKIEEEINIIKDRVGGEEKLEEKLEFYDITEDKFRRDIKTDLLISLFMEELFEQNETDVTEEELKEIYEEQMQIYEEKQKMIQEEMPDTEISDEITREMAKREKGDLYDFKSFEDITPELEEMIKYMRKQQQFSSIIEQLKEESEIEILK